VAGKTPHQPMQFVCQTIAGEALHSLYFTIGSSETLQFIALKEGNLFPLAAKQRPLE
jgi:hypothetical protein